MPIPTNGRWLNWACSVTIALGGLIYGIDTGIVSTTIAQKTFNLYMFGTTDKTKFTAFTGAMVSCYYAGQTIGSFGIGWMMDRLGRKWSLQICTFFTIVGSAVQTGSINIGMFLAGRVIAGIATGGLLTLVPPYIAELAPPETRARLVGMKGLLVAIGYLIANWIGYAGDYAVGDARWRIPLAMQIPMAILLMVLVVLLPESPRWRKSPYVSNSGSSTKRATVVSKDRYEEAQEVLNRLHGHRGDGFAGAEFAEISARFALEREQRQSRAVLREAFSRRYLRRTLLAIFILQMTKLSGSAIINNYQSLFYSGLGYKGRTVLLLAGVYGFMGVIGQIINLLFISDKWSRRLTVCLGSFTLAGFLALLTVMSALYGNGSNKDGAAAGIAFVFLFSLFYAVFFNSTVWVLVSEIFPQHIRAQGNSFAVFCTSITQIWLSQVTPLAFASLAWKFYFVFIALNCAGGLIYYFFLPETNQKTLEEIAEAFEGSSAKVLAEDTENGLDDGRDHKEQIARVVQVEETKSAGAR
ncbi:related to sugar transport protein STP1 [Phialocephala subalpina]|uniref:Related to sugar transport protein STP1 n=1 Tax=Phialocephala subalpina TaxID=576137 RepID=A0A1L7X6U4_9HELO|nr:related to sugar transport protein STP1 [Phialocephala subalpina]